MVISAAIILIIAKQRFDREQECRAGISLAVFPSSPFGWPTVRAPEMPKREPYVQFIIAEPKS